MANMKKTETALFNLGKVARILAPVQANKNWAHVREGTDALVAWANLYATKCETDSAQRCNAGLEAIIGQDVLARNNENESKSTDFDHVAEVLESTSAAIFDAKLTAHRAELAGAEKFSSNLEVLMADLKEQQNHSQSLGTGHTHLFHESPNSNGSNKANSTSQDSTPETPNFK